MGNLPPHSQQKSMLSLVPEVEQRQGRYSTEDLCAGVIEAISDGCILPNDAIATQTCTALTRLL